MLQLLSLERTRDSISTNDERENRPPGYRRSSRIALPTTSSTSSSKKKLQNDNILTGRAMKSSSTLIPKFNQPPPINRIVFPTGFRTRRRPRAETSSVTSSMNLSTDESLIPNQSDKESSVSDYQIPSCSYSGLATKSETDSMLCEYVRDFTNKANSEEEIMMTIERRSEIVLPTNTKSSNDNDHKDNAATTENQPSQYDTKPRHCDNFTKVYEMNTQGSVETKYQDTKPGNTSRSQPIPFECHMCLFRSYEKLSLQRHYSNKHSLYKNNNRLTFPCKICNKNFKGKAYFQTHLLNHNELDSFPYSCSACTLSFRTICELENHHLTHEYDLNRDPNEIDMDEPREKTSLLLCNRCSLGFDSQAALEKHRRRHIETLSTLPEIGKSPVAMGKSPIDEKHRLSTSTGNFKSKKTKTNASKALLKANVSKIKAKYKKNKFSMPGKGLRKIDPGFNLLFCPYCPSRFSHKNGVGIANLNTHLVLKHQDKHDCVNPVTDLFKCPFCVKMFISERSLSIHVIKKHEANEKGEHTENEVKVRLSGASRMSTDNGKYKVPARNRSSDVNETKEANPKTSPRKSKRGDPMVLRKANAAVERRTRLDKRIRRRKNLMRKRMASSIKRKNRLTKHGDNDTSLDDFDLINSPPAPIIRKRGRPPSRLRCVNCRLKFLTDQSLEAHKESCNVKEMEKKSEDTTVPDEASIAPKGEEKA